jgi:hypothetical protein
MKKLTLAILLSFGAAVIAAPSVARATSTDAVSAQTVVKKKVVVRRGGDSARRKVIIRRGDRGMHRGWRHSRHHGATRSKTVIKKRGGTTVIKKKVVR